MRIIYISDVHNEVYNKNSLLEIPADTGAVLVVAGDINVKGRTVQDLEAVAGNFKAVVAVLGNHDWWYLALHETHKFETDVPNLHILREETIKIDDVTFCGTTLWHDIPPALEWDWRQRMMDGKKIRGYNYHRLSPNTITAMYRKALDFIRDCKSINGKKVLVTHMGMSFKSIHPMYEHASTNDFYTSANDALLEGFTYHFHGHVHQEMSYETFGCKVLVSPLGYPGERISYVHQKCFI